MWKKEITPFKDTKDLDAQTSKASNAKIQLIVPRVCAIITISFDDYVTLKQIDSYYHNVGIALIFNCRAICVLF